MGRLAKSHLGSGAGVVAVDRFVLMPLGLGKFVSQGLQLMPEGRRRHRLSQDMQASTAVGLMCVQSLRQIG